MPLYDRDSARSPFTLLTVHVPLPVFRLECPNPTRSPLLISDRDTRAREVARRRTFAIISHPDAGKTTLTEKLLLYSGAIELAGMVRGGKTRKSATSDWMEMEQQRGISITAAALEFEMDGHRVNLLDTPGHQDFSEDTYRTLLAVDSVVMVLDAAKGIEAQTLKLFQVCRDRRIPVLTFINKLDLPVTRSVRTAGRDRTGPRDLRRADELAARRRAELPRASTTCEQKALLLYERSARGTRTEPIAVTDPSDPMVEEIVGPNRQRELIEALEIIAGAGTHVRRGGLSCRDADAGLLRQRAAGLRRGTLPESAAAAGARHRGRGRATRASSIRPTPTSPGSSSRFRRT